MELPHNMSLQKTAICPFTWTPVTTPTAGGRGRISLLIPYSCETDFAVDLERVEYDLNPEHTLAEISKGCTSGSEATSI